MLFWIILIILAIPAIYTLVQNHRIWHNLGETLLYTIFALFAVPIVSFLICLLISLPVQCFCSTHINTTKVETTYQVVSLNDNFGTTFIRCGYGEDGLKYTFLYNTDEGIKTKSISADKACINYTDEAPHIEVYPIYFDNSIVDFLFGRYSTYYYIYIPKGTLTEGYYNINLE